MTAGKQLRDDGWAATLAAGTAVHRTFVEHAERILADLARSGEVFSADDISARLPKGVLPRNQFEMGALIGSWASARRIERVGEMHSPRASRRWGRNGRWVGVAASRPPDEAA